MPNAIVTGARITSILLVRNSASRAAAPLVALVAACAPSASISTFCALSMPSRKLPPSMAVAALAAFTSFSTLSVTSSQPRSSLACSAGSLSCAIIFCAIGLSLVCSASSNFSDSVSSVPALAPCTPPLAEANSAYAVSMYSSPEYRPTGLSPFCGLFSRLSAFLTTWTNCWVVIVSGHCAASAVWAACSACSQVRAAWRSVLAVADSWPLRLFASWFWALAPLLAAT